MNKKFAADLVIIEPWQARVYRASTRQFTLNQAIRTLMRFDGHRQALHVKAEAAAATGVGTVIRICLIKVASVDATSKRMLERKMRTLVEHRSDWAAHPMTAAAIEAAVISDVVTLKLGSAEEERVRRQLRCAA